MFMKFITIIWFIMKILYKFNPNTWNTLPEKLTTGVKHLGFALKALEQSLPRNFTLIALCIGTALLVGGLIMREHRLAAEAALRQQNLRDNDPIQIATQLCQTGHPRDEALAALLAQGFNDDAASEAIVAVYGELPVHPLLDMSDPDVRFLQHFLLLNEARTYIQQLRETEISEEQIIEIMTENGWEVGVVVEVLLNPLPEPSAPPLENF